MTIGIPSSSEKDYFPLVYGGFIVRRNTNLSIVGFFPEGYYLYDVVTGHPEHYIKSKGCSCSFYPLSSPDLAEELLERKYKAKGWSEEKVRRAIESKKRSGAAGNSSVQKSFVNSIANVAKGNGSVALFVHFYDSPDHRFSKNITKEKSILEDFIYSNGVFPEDTVIVVNVGDAP